MKRSAAIGAISSVATAGLGVAIGSRIPPQLPEPIAHAKPGDVLVFQIKGSMHDVMQVVRAVSPALQDTGVTAVFVNESVGVCVHTRSDEITLPTSLESDAGTCGFGPWGQDVVDLRGDSAAGGSIEILQASLRSITDAVAAVGETAASISGKGIV